MKRLTFAAAIIALTETVIFAGGLSGQTSPDKLISLLKGPLDLGGGRVPEVRFFLETTEYVHIGFDGKRTGSETYTLKLKCVPAALSGKGGDEYTCRVFRLKLGEGPEETVPALAGWSYVFAWPQESKGGQKEVLGIPHARFEGLVDSRGNKLTLPVSYSVFNSFVDFHSFNDVFARPSPAGAGIQDLKTIGQRLVHSAAFSEPPVNLGAGFKEGSVFRNGEITLELKGVSLVDGTACALVGYDSGESTLKMIMSGAPGKEIVTVGGSEYKGDLFIDLATRWVRKATMDEFVVTQTTVPGLPQKIEAYVVRHLLTRLISREEFER